MGGQGKHDTHTQGPSLFSPSLSQQSLSTQSFTGMLLHTCSPPAPLLHKQALLSPLPSRLARLLHRGRRPHSHPERAQRADGLLLCLGLPLILEHLVGPQRPGGGP